MNTVSDGDVNEKILSPIELGEIIRKQAVKDREEAMQVLKARHGQDVAGWPFHIRAHFERLQVAQAGSQKQSVKK